MSKMLLGTLVAIRLLNGDAVPPGVLEQAEKAVTAIFARAGVRVEWLDCRRSDCGTTSGLRVQILSQPAGAAGYAVIGPETRYAVVRYPVVEKSAAALAVDAAPVLGATMAHEVGHLLLGKGHSERGVMSPRLGRKEFERAARGELAFTGEEAQRIRQTLPTGAAR